MNAKNNKRNSVLIGFELDTGLLEVLEKRRKELGVTKRKYVNDLILKDLGYTIIPAQIIPPRIVKIQSELDKVLESDEDSV